VDDKFKNVGDRFSTMKSHQHKDFVINITVVNEIKLTDISDSLYLSMPNQNEVVVQYCVC